MQQEYMALVEKKTNKKNRPITFARSNAVCSQENSFTFWKKRDSYVR